MKTSIINKVGALLVVIALVAIIGVASLNVVESFNDKPSPFGTKDYRICSLQCEIDYPNARPELPGETAHQFRIDARNYKRFCRNMCRNEATRTRAEALLENLVRD